MRVRLPPATYIKTKENTMAIELHHLHPSHDDELTRLKARIAELERMDTEHTLQIAKMNGYIHHLEEERRWRKCCEGLPSKGQRVLFLAKYKTDKVREWIGDFRHIDGMEIGFAVFYASAPGWGCEFLIDEVIGWMPLPSAPKED